MNILEQKKRAMESEMEFVIAQNNLNIPMEPGMGESDLVELRLKQLQWDRDKIDVQLAEKRLEMFELQELRLRSRPSLQSGEASRRRSAKISASASTRSRRSASSGWTSKSARSSTGSAKGRPWFRLAGSKISRDAARGSSASLTFVVEQKKDGSGIRTIAFDVQPRA